MKSTLILFRKAYVVILSFWFHPRRKVTWSKLSQVFRTPGSMTYVCYILNHIAYGALNGSIPQLVLYGIAPDISIMLLHTFYPSILCYS